jgi:4-hydroxy-tetrahydrodipicolinate synthase
MDKFTGTGVAMITPFLTTGEVDYKSLSKIINHLISNNIDYILINGTTSESACLTSKERNEILNFSIKEINGRVPIMYGLGGNNTQAVINMFDEMDFSNIDGILCVSPYYNKPNQNGLYEHFAAIAKKSPVDIVLYNVPGRTGVNISLPTILNLVKDFKNITGIKEASGNMDFIMSLLKNKPDNFEVLSGDDALTMPMIALGAKGIISVLANAFPKDWSNMTNLSLQGNFKEALKIHNKYLDTINNMFAEGNPCGVKTYMYELGLIDNNLRLPLVKASENLYKIIKKDINRM